MDNLNAVSEEFCLKTKKCRLESNQCGIYALLQAEISEEDNMFAETELHKPNLTLQSPEPPGLSGFRNGSKGPPPLEMREDNDGYISTQT